LATLVKSGTPSLASALPDASQKITGLLAGEAIAVGDVCYIAAAGTIFRSNGTAATAPAKCDGMAVVAAAIGEAVTLIHDVNVRYGATLTPGARYYVSATPGALDDAATTGGTAPVAFAIDATRIHVMLSRY
jgi:hypothetical protein